MTFLVDIYSADLDGSIGWIDALKSPDWDDTLDIVRSEDCEAVDSSCSFFASRAATPCPVFISLNVLLTELGGRVRSWELLDTSDWGLGGLELAAELVLALSPVEPELAVGGPLGLERMKADWFGELVIMFTTFNKCLLDLYSVKHFQHDSPIHH